MAEQTQADSDSNKAPNSQKGNLRFVVAIVFGILIPYSILIGVAIWYPYLSERIKFGTENGLSIAILIAVIAQVVINRKQWQAMVKQSKETEAQANAARDAARLAKVQLISMKSQERAMYGQLRAYVTANILNTGDGSHQWRLRIENSGNTPANNVCVYYDSDFRDSPPWDWTAPEFLKMPERQLLFETVLPEIARLGVIAPNGGFQPVRTKKVETLERDGRMRWHANDLKFFCWGVIVYEDMFGNEWRTWFCFYESQRHPEGYPAEHGNVAT